MASRAVPRLQVLAAAALFSTGGAAIKACSLGAWQVASFRSGIAALALLVLLPAARRGWSRRTLAVGVVYAATVILFVAANKLTTSANTIFLQSTAPLYVLLLGPRLLGERIRPRDVALMAAIALGMGMFFVGTEAPLATAPDPVLGNVLAALSGVTFALTILGMRWLARSSPGGGSALAAVAAGNLLAFLLALAPALPVGPSRPGDWVLLLFLGVVQIGVAYAALAAGMSRVPAFEASILLLVEPVLNPIWSFAVHGEVPGPWALAGGGLILAATALKTWWGARRPLPLGPAP
ncbi:MAG TPA: DMT family transporter [Planctomycetota bacterium]|nr:DMT family transporter [Planctomycetota bacterium]